MKYYSRRRRMCEWDDLDSFRKRFQQQLASGQPISGLSPFSLLAMPDISAEEQRSFTERYMQARLDKTRQSRIDCAAGFLRDKQADAEQESASVPGMDGPASPKVRLGYLSCDFHDHATALLLIEVLENHNRQVFELIAYSYGADDGFFMRQRLLQTFDRFVDIQRLSDREAAQLIHDDGIDILIDLKGFTLGTRTEILTYRPAPVQVNYLGFPGTLGGDVCDYIVTDHFVTPAQSAANYSEAFAYLPGSYQPHSRYSEIGRPPGRTEVGLPETGFVFCCFNQSYKITPAIFAVWCKLLAHCPGSVLWLLQDNMADGNLRNQAMQQGVMPDRLIFAGPVGQVEHLGRLQLADLVLDTLPYNAHTTASDALWVGVPLVTCPGDIFAARVGGSLLHAIGLPELVTETLDDYYRLAQTLATDAMRYQQIKQKLAAQRLTTPLFDVVSYTRHLENLFLQMWSIYQAGESPRQISTQES